MPGDLSILSLVINFVCGYMLLDVIDCKVCAMSSARQHISFCLTAYIRRITSEWLWRTGSSHTHDLSSIDDKVDDKVQHTKKMLKLRYYILDHQHVVLVFCDVVSCDAKHNSI